MLFTILSNFRGYRLSALNLCWKHLVTSVSWSKDQRPPAKWIRVSGGEGKQFVIPQNAVEDDTEQPADMGLEDDVEEVEEVEEVQAEEAVEDAEMEEPEYYDEEEEERKKEEGLQAFDQAMEDDVAAFTEMDMETAGTEEAKLAEVIASCPPWRNRRQKEDEKETGGRKGGGRKGGGWKGGGWKRGVDKREKEKNMEKDKGKKVVLEVGLWRRLKRRVKKRLRRRMKKKRNGRRGGHGSQRHPRCQSRLQPHRLCHDGCRRHHRRQGRQERQGHLQAVVDVEVEMMRMMATTPHAAPVGGTSKVAMGG